MDLRLSRVSLNVDCTQNGFAIHFIMLIIYLEIKVYFSLNILQTIQYAKVTLVYSFIFLLYSRY